MKARIIINKDIFHLLLCSGEIKKMNKEEIVDFLETYDDPIHYQCGEGWNFPISMEDYPGETIAYVTDEDTLVFSNSNAYRSMNNSKPYLTTEEYAAKYGKAKSLILRFCVDGRLEGAYKRGASWCIPANAPYPVKQRKTKSNSGNNLED